MQADGNLQLMLRNDAVAAYMVMVFPAKPARMQHLPQWQWNNLPRALQPHTSHSTNAQASRIHTLPAAPLAEPLACCAAPLAEPVAWSAAPLALPAASSAAPFALPNRSGSWLRSGAAFFACTSNRVACQACCSLTP